MTQSDVLFQEFLNHHGSLPFKGSKPVPFSKASHIKFRVNTGNVKPSQFEEDVPLNMEESVVINQQKILPSNKISQGSNIKVSKLPQHCSSLKTDKPPNTTPAAEGPIE